MAAAQLGGRELARAHEVGHAQAVELVVFGGRKHGGKIGGDSF